MPIRNPFTRRPGPAILSPAGDENLRPDDQNPSHPGFEKQDTVGSKASSSLSLKSSKSQDNGEYKMSVVNDSGVYLPPSPTEEKGLWPRKYLGSGRNSTDTRNDSGEIEHFSISRESFDSYRRSFDITARSPIPQSDFPARQSLDSARYPRLPRSAIDRRADRDLPTADEGFEDVGLDDQKHHQHQPSRMRGLFSRFGDSDHKEPSANSPNSSVTRFLSGAGRKRGQSGQGSELGTIERPKSAASVETTEVH
ncbi:hypothetical protein ColTof4_04868 [Colletotrichum tofieldiae]|uniref:Uncharacterized protein n=2 Tax=Colletotrichum spaethianum species complex TaxID=2707349 RepID=A0A161W6W2_9PEZI|nr:hypothetical protein CT0861_04067 [Colletotrichum tofieldiae]GJC87020.1 hypothetical protein ColLi_09858 [Colletotrichum liriopes]GKT63544.1 hypothetical protein ColTof3_10883 [Colletotrichum tofieldiae]GKT72445.1 hypothetical protein ColTof4_04868 [Colletotrichum tofieldiae]GKT89723.1 hypothetical protein Ct61P_07573 [Colletotrichum tofieldiae]